MTPIFPHDAKNIRRLMGLLKEREHRKVTTIKTRPTKDREEMNLSHMKMTLSWCSLSGILMDSHEVVVHVVENDSDILSAITILR